MSVENLWHALESGVLYGAAQADLPSLQRVARAITGDDATETPVLELYKRLGISGCIRFARSWPAAYELFRTRLNEEAVSVLPKERQERAQRLVWRIDAERNRHSTPLGATKALSEMARASMFGENGLRDHLQHLLGEGELAPTTNAKVLPFRRP